MEQLIEQISQLGPTGLVLALVLSIVVKNWPLIRSWFSRLTKPADSDPDPDKITRTDVVLAALLIRDVLADAGELLAVDSIDNALPKLLEAFNANEAATINTKDTDDDA